MKFRSLLSAMPVLFIAGCQMFEIEENLPQPLLRRQDGSRDKCREYRKKIKCPCHAGTDLGS